METALTRKSDARWQRVVLTALAALGVLLAFAVPAGQFVPNLTTFLLAAVVAALASGNRRYKLIVLIGLALLVALVGISTLWT
jgi:hypothetical protein